MVYSKVLTGGGIVEKTNDAGNRLSKVTFKISGMTVRPVPAGLKKIKQGGGCNEGRCKPCRGKATVEYDGTRVNPGKLIEVIRIPVTT